MQKLPEGTEKLIGLILGSSEAEACFTINSNLTSLDKDISILIYGLFIRCKYYHEKLQLIYYGHYRPVANVPSQETSQQPLLCYHGQS